MENCSHFGKLETLKQAMLDSYHFDSKDFFTLPIIGHNSAPSLKVTPLPEPPLQQPGLFAMESHSFPEFSLCVCGSFPLETVVSLPLGKYFRSHSSGSTSAQREKHI